MNGYVGVFSFEQYLEPMPLIIKGYHFRLIKTDGHDNADIK